MTRTEDEARKCWCPFVRGTATIDGQIKLGQGSLNRFWNDDGEPLLPRGARCIGSFCMAWRWAVPDPATYENGGAPGYCGLAGEPK